MNYTSKRLSAPNPRQWSIKRGLLFFSPFILALNLTNATADSEPANKVHSGKKFQSATNCIGCHPVQYSQWSVSMMAYASLSPVIGALEKVENRRHSGELDRLNDPNSVHGRLARTKGNPKTVTGGPSNTENQLVCQKCHSPIGVATDMFPDYDSYENKDSAKDEPDSRQVLESLGFPSGSQQDKNHKAALEGVTCVACHRITGPNGSDNRSGFEPGIANNAYLLDGNEDTDISDIINYGPFLPYDGNGNAAFPFEALSESSATEHKTGFSVLRIQNEFGQISSIATPSKNEGMLFLGEDGIQRPYIKTSEFCGTCHDVRLANKNGSGARRLENLFSEWRNSPWNNNDNIPNGDGLPDSYQNGLSSQFENPREFVTTKNNQQIKSITSCQDCHMSTYMKYTSAKPGSYDEGPIAFNQSAGVAKTDHSFVGVDRALINFPDDETLTEDQMENRAIQAENQIKYRKVLLQKAVNMKIVHAKIDIHNQLDIALSVMNVGSGHNVPAGFSQERQVWIDLKVHDAQGVEVYKSGYLVNHKEEETDEHFCDREIDGVKVNEWKCDLDDITLPDGARLNAQLEAVDQNGNYVDLLPGGDTALVNYQNEFKRKSEFGFESVRVLNPFTSDEADNSHSLKPFVNNGEYYINIPLDNFKAPFNITAKLRFRPFPHEFLEALSHSSNRITEDVMKANTIIEMERDSCTTQLNPKDNLRLCNSSVPQIALARKHACLLGSGQLSCWGDNAYGQLGIGNKTDQSTMATTVSDAKNIKQVAVGRRHSCYVTSDGKVSCWGDDGYGQLGVGTSDENLLQPTEVNNLPSIYQIALGRYHTCAITIPYGTVQCWGRGETGALGNGASSNSPTPVSVYDDTGNELRGIRMLALGYNYSCALDTEGLVSCWGKGSKGQLGNGSTNSSNIPVPVDLGYPATAITAGAEHACALLRSGDVMCWGNGNDGRLGDGALGTPPYPHNALSPIKVAISNVASISAGYRHTCATDMGTYDTAGGTNCWGYKSSFIGTTTIPVGVTTETTAVATGKDFSCAILEKGGIQCWGEGSDGQLGNNVRGDSVLPVDVIWSQVVLNYNAEFDIKDFADVGSQSWHRDSNGTPSSNTGPSSGAHGSGYYYHFEATGRPGYAGKTASLETDVFDPSSTSLSFDYHMYGSAIGELKVEVLVNGREVDTLWSRSGNKGNQWLNTGDLDLSAYRLLYDKIQLRITNTATGKGAGATDSSRGSYWEGDTALDNIRVIRQ